jgi:hypothetical protein
MNNKKHKAPSERSNASDDNSSEHQWVNLGKNKTSWIWKYFGVKTDGRAYCKYKNGSEKECDWSCVYNSQTSSMNHHLGSVHKEYEQEKQVMQIKFFFLNSFFLKKKI